MTDDQLRDFIRESVARHLGAAHVSAAPAIGRTHASHVLLPVPPGAEGDGACIIEPAVRCNHCGYCQSYGH